MAKRFHFHGEALGFAGRVRVPYEKIIPVQAASVLSELGGLCTGVSRDFRFHDLIQFDLAHTEVTGSEVGDEYATMIQSTVEGLNINGMVTADRIVARIFSSYREELEGEPPMNYGEPSIKLIGTRFENLRIAGVPVEVELAVDLFDEFHKHHLVCEEFEAKDVFRKAFGELTFKGCYEAQSESVKKYFHRPPENAITLPSNKGFTELTLVKKLTPQSSGLSCPGQTISIPGFGTIRLAILQLSQYTRRLTMLDISLGCALIGDIKTCEIQDGGVEW